MFIAKRRAFLAGLSGLGVSAALPLPALALNEASAEALINKVVADINQVIASGKNEAGMIAEFKRIFDRYGDNSAIAASAFGTDVRRATEAQKGAFSEAFAGYISRKYGKRFREFIGGKIDVTGVRQVKKWYEVDANVNLRGQAPFRVTFFVSDRTGRDLFFNISIEGVNLLLTERREIGDMLDRRGGNIDAMIADLRNAG